MRKINVEQSGAEPLRIIETITKAFHLYKTGFKPLIYLSLIGFVLNTAIQIVDLIQKSYGSIVSVKIGMGLLEFILTFLYLLFVFRIDIASYYVVQNLIENRSVNITAREAFEKSKQVWGQYLGGLLCLIILLIFPVATIWVSLKFVGNIVLKYILILAGGLLFLRISGVYAFVPLSAIFNPKDHGHFDESKRITKGNVMRVIAIYLLTSYVFMMPYQVFHHSFKNGMSSHLLALFAISMANSLLILLTRPLSYSAVVLMYNKLKGGLDTCQ